MEKMRIMVIDDEQKNVKLLEACLSPQGYEVHGFLSAVEALEKLEAINPHLIILDINMPEMSGITFYERISDRQGHPRFPVVVLTARSNIENLFKDFFVDGFMTKPFDMDQLVTEVRTIVSKRYGEATRKMKKNSDIARNILIVESEQGVLDNGAICFIRAGYSVSSSRSGTFALERAFMDPPDVILVNLRLSDMSGDAFISKLKRMPKTMDIAVVLYSEFGSSVNPSVINQVCKKMNIPELVGTSDPQVLLDTVKSIF